MLMVPKAPAVEQPRSSTVGVGAGEGPSAEVEQGRRPAPHRAAGNHQKGLPQGALGPPSGSKMLTLTEDEPGRHEETPQPLFPRAWGWKPPKCPSAGERAQDEISRTMEGHSDLRRNQVRHATTWVDLETFCR